MFAMISQPMRGIDEDEIVARRAKAITDLNNMGYGVINTLFDYNPSTDNPISMLSKSMNAMAQCELVYFLKGWDNARGCKIEHAVAEAYGLKIWEET